MQGNLKDFRNCQKISETDQSSQVQETTVATVEKGLIPQCRIGLKKLELVIEVLDGDSL
jgi:hypothetical protein